MKGEKSYILTLRAIGTQSRGNLTARQLYKMHDFCVKEDERERASYASAFHRVRFCFFCTKRTFCKPEPLMIATAAAQGG